MISLQNRLFLGAFLFSSLLSSVSQAGFCDLILGTLFSRPAPVIDAAPERDLFLEQLERAAGLHPDPVTHRSGSNPYGEVGDDLQAVLARLPELGATLTPMAPSNSNSTYYYSNPYIGSGAPTVQGALPDRYTRPVGRFEYNGEEYFIMRNVTTYTYREECPVGCTRAEVRLRFYNRNFTEGSDNRMVYFDTRQFDDLTSRLRVYLIKAKYMSEFEIYQAK